MRGKERAGSRSCMYVCMYVCRENAWIRGGPRAHEKQLRTLVRSEASLESEILDHICQNFIISFVLRDMDVVCIVKLACRSIDDRLVAIRYGTVRTNRAVFWTSCRVGIDVILVSNQLLFLSWVYRYIYHYHCTHRQAGLLSGPTPTEIHVEDEGCLVDEA